MRVQFTVSPSSLIHVSNSHASSPGFLLRRQDRLHFIFPPLLSGEPRARGTPGVPMDPRASTPRDIEACRSPCVAPSLRELRRANRKSARSQGVPRAVFVGLLRTAPGGLTVSGTLSVNRVTIHRMRPRHSVGAPLTGEPAYRPSGARQRLACRDWRGLDRRGPASHLRRRHCRPPLPAPRLETLIRHPSATGAGCDMTIIL